MCKKLTSFLALFLAFAMAITGMPANYAYAVETEIETETQSEEVLDETTEDEEEILDDEIDTEVIDEELADDSEELGDEEDESLLDEEISNEIPEETEVATTSSSWRDTADLCGGYLTLNPDEGAFTGDATWTVENRFDDSWSYIFGEWDEETQENTYIGNLSDVIYENTGIDTYRVDSYLVQAEFFNLGYEVNGEKVDPEEGKKVKVTYHFSDATDWPLKQLNYGIGGPDEDPTLIQEFTNFYFQVYQIDSDENATLISDNFGKDVDEITFDSELTCSYMIIRLPADDNEVIYHFNNYDDTADDKCYYQALSNWCGSGNVTFDIEGTNTWNARPGMDVDGEEFDEAFCYSLGDIYFTGDGTITINADIYATDGNGNIHFAGPTVNLNGDIWPGEDIYPGVGAPKGADKEKYPNMRLDCDGKTVLYYYQDKGVFLDEGDLNFTPKKLWNKMVVNGGMLRAKGETIVTSEGYEPLFDELQLIGGQAFVGQTNDEAGCLVNKLIMGDAYNVTIDGVNCVGTVTQAENSSRAQLRIQSRGIGVLNGLFWKDGNCNIWARDLGVGGSRASIEGGVVYICTEEGEGCSAPVYLSGTSDNPLSFDVNSLRNGISNNLTVSTDNVYVDIVTPDDYKSSKAVSGRVIISDKSLKLFEGMSSDELKLVSAHNTTSKFIKIADNYWEDVWLDVSGGNYIPEHEQYSRIVAYGDVYGKDDGIEKSLPTADDFEERIGYKFVGWFIQKWTNRRHTKFELGEPVYNDTVLTSVSAPGTWPSLVAGWEKLPVHVTLDANGGTIRAMNMNPEEKGSGSIDFDVPYGEKLDLDPNSIYHPETTEWFENIGRKGYKFVGWSLDKKDVADGSEFTSYRMPKSGEDSMDPVTFYAVWEKELTVNAPELKDIDGKPITEDKTLPKNSKLFLSTTVNVNGVKTPADSDVVEIYYRTADGVYKLYTDAIVVTDNLTISAFAVEKGVVEEGERVDDTWVDSHVDDIVKLNSGTPIVISKKAPDLSGVDEGDRDSYVEDDFWVVYRDEFDYTGKAITQSSEDVHVYFDNKRLVEKTDYTLSYKNNTNAGTATMIVTFKGNYSGKREKSFTINPLDISGAIAPDVTVIETGKKLKPTTKVTYELGGKVVTLGTKDFDYVEPTGDGVLVNPGKYEITVKGKGNYKGSKIFIYEIGSKTENVLMSKANIKLASTKVDYWVDGERENGNGIAKTPTVTVKDGSKELTGGIEASAYNELEDEEKEAYSFTYEYLNNVEVGTATVLVKGTGYPDTATEKAYIGEKTATFTISGKAMSSAIVKKDITATKQATGEAITPLNEDNANPDSDSADIADFAVTYKLGKPAVESGIKGIDAKLYDDLSADDKLDYDYIYEYVGDTTTAGKVSIKLTGVNGFTGTKTVTYTIKAITLNAQNCTYTIDTEHDYYGSGIDGTYFVYDGTQKIPGAIVADKNSGDMVKGVDYVVLYGENIKAGKNKATVVIKGMGRYSGSVTMKFDIAALDLNDVENVTIDDGDEDNDFVDGANIYYEKGGVKPDGFLAFNGEPLVLGTDYTATHKNNSKIGEATVTFKGKGNFTGTYEVKYNIVKQDLKNVGIVATDIVYQDKANICKPKVTLTDLNGKALAQKTDYDANLVYTYNKSTTVKQKVKSGKITVEKEIIRSAGDLVDLKNDIIPEGTEIRVTVTANENGKYAGSKFYEGSTSTVFRVAGKDISKATVKVKDQVMTGEPIYITKDDITEITINKVPLDPSDYVIMNSTYTKNVGKGKASVTIRGVGNYGGTKVINFNIVAPKAQ